MISSVNFRGSETTGSVADRRIESAKQETTGGVGARKNQGSIFTIDNEPKQDTVCFRGKEYGNKKETSTTAVVLGTLAAVAATVGLLGLAHKYNWVDKIGHEKTKEFFKHADGITEPCHNLCKFVKNNSYDKIVAWFKK